MMKRKDPGGGGGGGGGGREGTEGLGHDSLHVRGTWYIYMSIYNCGR